MEKYTLFVSRSVSVTVFENKITIRADSSRYKLPQEFYMAFILITATLSLCYYFEGFNSNEGLIIISIIIFLSLIGITTQIKFLLRYWNLKEELIISLKEICFKKNDRVRLRREFKTSQVCFNIENEKYIVPKYNEQQNTFNPMICLIDRDKKHYIMRTLDVEECSHVLDLVEEWYLENDIIDLLKIYRKSTNELTLYKIRYWKCNFTSALAGGIR